MFILRSLQVSCFALCAFGALVLPAHAQQRVQVGTLIERLDRLETEVTRLRVSSGGGGGGDLARLDQIEQELRRLTGIIERLEYDNRQATSTLEKRLDGFADRLSSVENGSAPSASRPSVNTDSSFARSNPAPAQNPPLGQEFTGFNQGSEPAPIYQPEATFQPQQDPFQAQPSQTFSGQPPQAGLQSANALYDDGIRLLNIGSFDQAGARFEDLIAAYPQDQKAGEAQFWLGDMHFKLGRYEQAASAFLDSFRNWPEGAKAPDSLLKLGMTLANIGKTEEACLSFKQVPARYPGASPSLLRRADIESQRYRCG